MEKVESQMSKKLKVNVKRVVSVFHGNDHFAVMEINLDTNVITIYDGLNLGLNDCFHHITNVLKRTKLIGRNSLPTFHSNGKLEFELVTLMRIAGSFQSQSLYIKKMGTIVARLLALSWVRFLNQKL